AAHPMRAPDVGSGLTAILTDGVGQRPPRLDADGVVAPIDVEGDVDLAGHARFSIERKAARIFRGVAGISSIETPNGARASLMALTTAAGAPIAPPSPTPLALVMEASLYVSMWCSSITGISRAVGGR